MSSEPNTGKREAPGWVGTPHGRFVYVIDGWQNEFHLRDHLGNTRLVLMEEDTGTLATLQQNHYYPFGMLNPSLSTSNTIGALKDNRYLYNGKELQDDFGLDWYDYGARFYDAQIGRFHVIDRFVDSYHSLSPYGYCAGNPIKYIDINGDFIGTLIGVVVGGAAGAYDAHKNNRSLKAGFAEGAVSGAIAGATVDIAVAATIASGGGALVVIGVGAAAGAAGGAAGAAAGDATGQVVESMVSGSTASDAISNISTEKMGEKMIIGAATGTIGGAVGGGIGKLVQVGRNSTRAIQSTMSNNASQIPRVLPLADDATVKAVQNAIEGGIEAVERSTRTAATTTSVTTQTAVKLIEEELK